MQEGAADISAMLATFLGEAVVRGGEFAPVSAQLDASVAHYAYYRDHAGSGRAPTLCIAREAPSGTGHDVRDNWAL